MGKREGKEVMVMLIIDRVYSQRRSRPNLPYNGLSALRAFKSLVSYPAHRDVWK